MTLYQLALQPFADHGFMRRALVASVALAAGSAPIGTILVLRRMSLVGDAMSHALLPGAGLGFVLAGFSIPAMGAGGFTAALAVALAAGFVTPATSEREDASFAAFYLIALALGVMLISTHGSSVDLLHVLFGTILAIDDTALIVVASVATISVVALAVVYRLLVAECLDPGFVRSVGARGSWAHGLFLVLTVLNLVAGFQALGTLMAVGVMMLPATAARFWAGQVWSQVAVAAGMAAVSGYVGLLLSFHAEWPSGPAIVLVAGAFYAVSLTFGARSGLIVVHVLSPRSKVA